METGLLNYIPLYFGPYQDTIYADYRRYIFPRGWRPFDFTEYKDGKPRSAEEIRAEYDSMDNEQYSAYYGAFLPEHQQICPHHETRSADTARLSVYVDTTQFIRNIDLKTIQDKTFSFKAYPVAIINPNQYCVFLGYDRYLYLMLEAKDSLNQWREVESRHTYFCTTGMSRIQLPPNELVLTSVKVFTGDYRTDMRLKIGDNYSNVFRGSMHYGQFTTTN